MRTWRKDGWRGLVWEDGRSVRFEWTYWPDFSETPPLRYRILYRLLRMVGK